MDVNVFSVDDVASIYNLYFHRNPFDECTIDTIKRILVAIVNIGYVSAAFNVTFSFVRMQSIRETMLMTLFKNTSMFLYGIVGATLMFHSYFYLSELWYNRNPIAIRVGVSLLFGYFFDALYTLAALYSATKLASVIRNIVCICNAPRSPRMAPP